MSHSAVHPVPEPTAPGDIRFLCPHCRQSLVVDRDGAGEVIPCPGCGEPIQIPAPAVLDPYLEELLQTWREQARRAETAAEDASAKLTVLQRELHEKETQLAEVLGQSHAQTAARETALAALAQADAKLDALTNSLALKSEECGRLLERLDQSNAERHVLAQTLETCRAELSAARSECEATGTARDVLAAQLEKSAADFETAKSGMEATLATVRDELAHALSEADLSQRENRAQQTQIADLETRLDASAKALAQLEAQQGETLQTIALQTVEISSSKQDAVALREMLEQSQSAERRLDAELRETKAELAKTSEQLHKLRTERSQFTFQDQQTVREMSKVREQLSLAQFEHERAAEELKKVKDKLKATQRARDEFAAELAAAKAKSPRAANPPREPAGLAN